MAITNQEVIRYSNEVVRPIAEKIRALKVEMDSAMVTWFSTISTNCPNSSSEVLEDGRSSEGVSILTGQDIVSVITSIQSLQTVLDAGGMSGIISKPCVRAISAL